MCCSGARRRQADMAAFENLFISIAGMIGAGKSTLCTALAEHLDVDAYYEPVDDNVYLADFYQEPQKHSFAMQVYLLNRRFQQHQEIIWRGRSAVQDRTIYEDSVFAKMLANQGLMSERNYETYRHLFQHMSNFMCRPNLIVYLDVTPERSLERIQKRSRGVETGIDLDYLNALYKEYESFISDISRVIPTVKVDYDRFASADEMAAMIKEEYFGHSFLREAKRAESWPAPPNASA